MSKFAQWFRKFSSSVHSPASKPKRRQRGRLAVEVLEDRYLLSFSPLVPIQIHAVQVTDDTGGHAANITAAQVKQWVDKANEIYAVAGIHFNFDANDATEWSVVHNTKINRMYYGDSAVEANAEAAKYPTQLTVFFRYGGEQNGLPTGNGFSGLQYNFVAMPGFNDTTVITGKGTNGQWIWKQNLWLFAHETGHYFGLDHTFPGNSDSVTDSPAKAAAYIAAHGANVNALDGDGLPDTPPDAGTAFYINQGWDPCVGHDSYTISSSDIPNYQGTPFSYTLTPDRHNIMSYFVCDPMTFSPLQSARMRDRLLIRAVTPVGQKYVSLGGANGFLGAPATSEFFTRDGAGVYQDFWGQPGYGMGSIYWSPESGAHEVHGYIRQAWVNLGGIQSALGYPITDELPATDGIGRISYFQGGAIYWSSSTGTRVENPPTVIDHAYRTDKLTTVSPDALHGLLQGMTNYDGSPLTIKIVSPPNWGSLTVRPDGSFDYTPGVGNGYGFWGVDSFQYQVITTQGPSQPATVRITVATPPVAGPVTNTVLRFGTTTAANSLLSNSYDAQHLPMTVVLLSQPKKGTLSNFDSQTGSFQYTPNAGATGQDSFAFWVKDQYNWSRDYAWSTINIGMPPSAGNHSYTVQMNGKLPINAVNGLLSSPTTDAEGDPMMATLYQAPQSGKVIWSSLNDGSFTYIPNPGFHGYDYFFYAAHDQDGNSVGTATIHVIGQVPVAHDDGPYSVPMNTQMRFTAANGVLANDTDAEHDDLTAVLVAGPSHGSIYYLAPPDPPPDPGGGGGHHPPMAPTWVDGLGPDGAFKYVPRSGYRGPDSFTYQAQDIDGLSNVATVRFSIFGKPYAAKDDSYNVIPNVPLSVNAANGVLANDTDAENDPPTRLVVVTGPAHGRVQLNLDGSFTYTPNQAFTGQDSFKYQVQDQDGLSNVATVTLIVQRRPPVANDDSYDVTLGDTLIVDAAHGVKANDTDAEGDPMTPTVQSGPSKGQLQFKLDGSFTYTFTGVFPPKVTMVTDRFTYVEHDQDGVSNVATVWIHVLRPDQGGNMSVVGTPTPAIAAQAPTASQLALSYGNFVYDVTTKYYKQTVTLKNTSGNPLIGPLSLALDNLIAGAKLVNQTGVIVKQGPAGSPYVDVPVESNVLTANQVLTITLVFDSPTAAITYNARILTDSGPR